MKYSKIHPVDSPYINCVIRLEMKGSHHIFVGLSVCVFSLLQFPTSLHVYYILLSLVWSQTMIPGEEKVL